MLILWKIEQTSFISCQPVFFVSVFYYILPYNLVFGCLLATDCIQGQPREFQVLSQNQNGHFSSCKMLLEISSLVLLEVLHVFKSSLDS
jgi:hypothetical protein